MSKPTKEEVLAQIGKQCRVVAHLARSLADVHEDYAEMYEAGVPGMADIASLVGPRTASFMETLGDMLNGMDAASDDDEWTRPVFMEAHRLWPPSEGR